MHWQFKTGHLTQTAAHVQGLRICTPVSSKSAVLRVTIVMPCTSAVAAMIWCDSKTVFHRLSLEKLRPRTAEPMRWPEKRPGTKMPWR